MSAQMLFTLLGERDARAMTHEHDDEQAIDIAGLAELLRVSKTTAYRLAVMNEVPGFKVGTRWRFWPSLVKAALAARDPWRRSNQARARRAAAQRKRGLS